MEPKWRLEATLEGQVGLGVRLGGVEWRLEGGLEAPKTLQELGSKDVQEELKTLREAPKTLQELPKTLQELPKTLQEAPKRLQVGLQRRPRGVQEPQNTNPSAIRQQTTPPL